MKKLLALLILTPLFACSHDSHDSQRFIVSDLGANTVGYPYAYITDTQEGRIWFVHGPNVIRELKLPAVAE